MTTEIEKKATGIGGIDLVFEIIDGLVKIRASSIPYHRYLKAMVFQDSFHLWNVALCTNQLRPILAVDGTSALVMGIGILFRMFWQWRLSSSEW